MLFRSLARDTDRDPAGRVDRVARPVGPISAVVEGWIRSPQPHPVRFEHPQVNRVAWGVGRMNGDHWVRTILGGSSSLRRP